MLEMTAVQAQRAIQKAFVDSMVCDNTAVTECLITPASNKQNSTTTTQTQVAVEHVLDTCATTGKTHSALTQATSTATTATRLCRYCSARFALVLKCMIHTAQQQ
jgi:hypothetical protein